MIQNLLLVTSTLLFYTGQFAAAEQQAKNARIHTQLVNSPDGSLVNTSLNRNFSLKSTIDAKEQSYFLTNLS